MSTEFTQIHSDDSIICAMISCSNVTYSDCQCRCNVMLVILHYLRRYASKLAACDEISTLAFLFTSVFTFQSMVLDAGCGFKADAEQITPTLTHSLHLHMNKHILIHTHACLL